MIRSELTLHRKLVVIEAIHFLLVFLLLLLHQPHEFLAQLCSLSDDELNHDFFGFHLRDKGSELFHVLLYICIYHLLIHRDFLQLLVDCLLE